MAKLNVYHKVAICMLLMVALTSLGLYLLVSRFVPSSFNSDLWVLAWRKFPAYAHSRFKPGMTRAEVTSAFGKPSWTIRSAKDLAYWQGDRGYVPPPPGPYRHPILVYHGATIWRVYVYLDATDRVTRIHLART